MPDLTIPYRIPQFSVSWSETINDKDFEWMEYADDYVEASCLASFVSGMWHHAFVYDNVHNVGYKFINGINV